MVKHQGGGRGIIGQVNILRYPSGGTPAGSNGRVRRTAGGEPALPTVPPTALPGLPPRQRGGHLAALLASAFLKQWLRGRTPRRRNRKDDLKVAAGTSGPGGMPPL